MGLSGNLVAEIYSPPGRAVGSGYFCTSRLVLTAKHVVSGALPMVGPPEISTLGEAGDFERVFQENRVACRVRSLAAGGGGAFVDAIPVWWSKNADVALLALAAQKTQPPVSRTITWADVPESEPLDVKAVGFPEADSENGVRESRQISGRLNPLSGVKAQRFVIQVSGSIRELPTVAESSWAGMSGAALFSGDFLVGVMLVDADVRHPERLELWALPARAFANDPAFLRWIRWDGGEGAWTFSSESPPTSMALLTKISESHKQLPAGKIGHEIQSLLPQPPRAFVGRKDVLDRVRNKLMPAHGRPGQIVALSAGAGAGKSAVATVLAHHPAVQQYYDCAVVWVRLRQEGARDMESGELRSRLYQLARSVGLNERDMEDVAGSNSERAAWIRGRLISKKLLLVVDDVWTTTQGVLLNVINTSCGASMLLLTRSRDVARELTVEGNLFELQPLSDEDATELLSRFSKSFVQDHPKECKNLIRAVKGLPLALSLLGSLLRNEEPYGDLGALAQRLSSLEELLSANVPPQTASYEGSVQKLLELSSEMMSEDARTRFFKLGAFHSGATFDLQSIAFVWEDSETSARKYIRELIGWSIISIEGQTDRPRFSVHALLQAYALRMLSNIQVVEHRHDQYYVQLARSLGPKIRGHEYKRALSALQEERDNIELALSRAASPQDIAAAAMAATDMVDFWYATGTCKVGFGILKRLIDQAYVSRGAGNAKLGKDSLVRALCGCAYLAFFTDDSFKTEARTYWRQAGEIRPEELDPITLAISLIGRLNGIDEYEDNQHIELVAQLVRTIADVENSVILGDAWAAIGWSQYYGEAYEKSIESLSKATALYRNIGDNLGLIEALNGVVLSSTEVNEYDTGEAAYRESLIALDQLGIEGLGSALYHNYGWMLLAKGDVANAKGAFRHSQEVNATLHGVEGMVGAGFVFEASACIAKAESRYARAAKLFGAAAGRRERTNDRLPEWMEEQYRPWIAEVAEALSQEKFAELFRCGQMLSDDEAAEYEMKDDV
jgi:tetratricopeptide (TPR) repeat protein